MGTSEHSEAANTAASGRSPDLDAHAVRAEILRRIGHRPASNRPPAAERTSAEKRETEPAPPATPPHAQAEGPRRSLMGGGFVLLLVFTVIVAVMTGYAVVKIWPHLKNPVAVQTIDRSQQPLLKSIQDLSHYVAAEGNFQQVIDLQHDRKYVPDFLVSDRTLFVAVATVEVYVEFGTIGSGAIQASADQKTVVITLPAPAMAKPNIDHAKSYVVAEQKGALNSLGDILGSDLNKEQEVYLKAEQEIGAAAANSGLADHAEANTRNMLQGMLHSLGYADVTVNFAKPE